MPLSSVVGAQSIVKPGVCTSLTRPASPYDGQVIYMTDVDQTAVWDGSSWVVLAPIASGRNVVINGAMQIAQRGTSTASIITNGYYTADRWSTQITTLGTWTQTVENDAPTGSGFRKSLKMLIASGAESPIGGTNDLCLLEQVFEGQNLQQFLKGTSSAKQFSLSFWVKSNVTGTYIVRFNDMDNTRSVAASYTISASATWEKKTITFPADTTGAFDNDNDASLRMQFWLAAGSAFTSGTLATTWQSTTAANLAVGLTNLAAATNNYWQVTGVQLEAGAVATPFEFEDYGTTLLKCQRYFVTYSGLSSAEFTVNLGFYMDPNLIRFPLRIPTMRSAPSVSYTGTANTDYAVYNNGGKQTGFTFGSEKPTLDSVILTADKTSHGLPTTPQLILGLTSSGKVNISSEL
ncbi:MAG: hypothetical protein EB164_09270 [Thaumarchaeota archaeon]|nr:hypothetical protein [Nitrososphaerota archaeon]